MFVSKFRKRRNSRTTDPKRRISKCIFDIGKDYSPVIEYLGASSSMVSPVNANLTKYVDLNPSILGINSHSSKVFARTKEYIHNEMLNISTIPAKHPLVPGKLLQWPEIAKLLPKDCEDTNNFFFRASQTLI